MNGTGQLSATGLGGVAAGLPGSGAPAGSRTQPCSPDYQLLYTSFQAPAGLGGWQVKWELGSGDGPLDRELRAQLLAGVRTELEPVAELAKFPTPAEREAFPRRLEHRPLSAGHTGLWHGIPAGPDRSGRPGNVAVTAFALSPGDRSAWAPCDFWRSPSFPTPFGPNEVAALVPPATRELRAGPLSTAHAVADFVLPAHPEPVRIELLGKLLDAAEFSVRSGGPGLLLVVGDSDEAAKWLAAISSFAPPAWNAALSWSTWERARHLGAPAVRNLQIVAVPQTDRGELARVAHGRIVVDPAVDLESDPEPTADEQGHSRWRFGAGAEVPVGAWSVQARACAAGGPQALASTFAALRSVSGGCPEAGPARELAWARAVAEGSAQAAAEYLAAVVDNPSWLLAPEPARATTASSQMAPAFTARVELGHRRLLRASGRGEVVAALSVLRMLDLLACAQIEVVRDVVLPDVVRVIGGDSGAELVALCGHLHSPELAAEVHRCLPRQVKGAFGRWPWEPAVPVGSELASGESAGSVTRFSADPDVSTREAVAPDSAALDSLAPDRMVADRLVPDLDLTVLELPDLHARAVEIVRQWRAGPDWRAASDGLTARSADWFRLADQEQSAAGRRAAGVLRSLGLSPLTCFLTSPLVSVDTAASAALAALAMHAGGGRRPGPGGQSADLNLLVAAVILTGSPAYWPVLRFYLPEVGRAFALQATVRPLAEVQALAQPLLNWLSNSGQSAAELRRSIFEVAEQDPATLERLRRSPALDVIHRHADQVGSTTAGRELP
ncbi:MAG: hypothetical protein ACOYEV_09040 [Candidatus Nanopelagicales bacterium]